MEMKQLVYLIYFAQIISGICLTIFVKLQDKQKIENQTFQHAYLQAIISFIGQTFNFALYKYQQKYQADDIQKQTEQALAENKKTFLPVKLLLIPAFLHCMCSMCGFAAYFHIQASISMMLSGSLPIITSLLSKIFFKREILKYQWYGMFVILLGSLLLGSAALQNEEKIEGANPYLGILLSILSLLLFGFLIIAEEFLLKNYVVQSTLIAGTEGAAAAVIGILLIPLLNLIWKDFVNYKLFFQQIEHSTIILIACFGIIFSDMFYTLFCILSTKYSTGVTRSVIFQLRCVGIWIVALCLPNPDYLKENQERWETFSIFQFCGYFILGLGVLVFNKNLKIPYLQAYNELEEEANKIKYGEQTDKNQQQQQIELKQNNDPLKDKGYSPQKQDPEFENQ